MRKEGKKKKKRKEGGKKWITTKPKQTQRNFLPLSHNTHKINLKYNNDVSIMSKTIK